MGKRQIKSLVSQKIEEIGYPKFLLIKFDLKNQGGRMMLFRLKPNYMFNSCSLMVK